MIQILVVGAGLSGCAAAERLARAGIAVAMVEKSERIGGRVRQYGCKATDRCNNCGVCLCGGLWEKVENHPRIKLFTSSRLVDLTGGPGMFSATIKTPEGDLVLDGLHAVVVAAGFEPLTHAGTAHLQTQELRGVITGTKIEELMMGRDATTLFSVPQPRSVAFVQCFGSRDQKEHAAYCSRVCCAYSTRAAKVLRQYYPECKIVFFYMELQSVANRDYYRELQELGIEFIKCRPLKIEAWDISGVGTVDVSEGRAGDAAVGGSAAPVCVSYDDPVTGPTARHFDLVVLSEGIHPAADSVELANVCGLQQDDNGFLQLVAGQNGLFVVGCARQPMKIEESYRDALAAADTILAEGTRNSGARLAAAQLSHSCDMRTPGKCPAEGGAGV